MNMIALTVNQRAVQAMAAVTAFFVAGVVGTYLGWRYAFGLVVPFSALTLLLSVRLYRRFCCCQFCFKVVYQSV